MKTTFKALGLLLALALTLTCGHAGAQNYPNKTIRFVVGYTPGGNNDIVARLVAQNLAQQLGQPVIVENKPGAEARIATEYVAKAAPDGYTLLIGATGAMVYNAGLYSNLSYDPVKDFVPITMFARTPLVFAVNPSVPAASIKELVELAKGKSGKLFYASGASPFHVAAELFNKQNGVDIVHVPFKGNVQAVNAAVAGEVPIVVADIPTSLAQVRAGKLRALAITGTDRSQFMPNIPTMLESGMDFEAGSWVGLYAPAGTPSAIIDKLYGALAKAMKSDSLKERFAGASFETKGMGMPPAEFAAIHKADLAKWTKVMKDLNIRAD